MKTIQRRKARAKLRFLEELAKDGIVTAAAERAGVNRTQAYTWRDEDPDFAAAWEQAVEESTERLEKAVYDRGLVGWDEPVYYKGDQVGTVRKFSDSNAQFMLKARRPNTYRDRASVEVSGKEGGPIELTSPLDGLLTALGQISGRVASKPAEGDAVRAPEQADPGPDKRP